MIMLMFDEYIILFFYDLNIQILLHFLFTDAMNCLYKQHMIDKRTLNVQKYDLNDPSLWEMDKALVTGLNPATTEDTLMNFLEPAAGVELKDLVRGAREDVAIVVSAEKPGTVRRNYSLKLNTARK